MRARAAPYLSACSRTAVAARWHGGRRRAAAQVGGGRARRPSGGMGLDAAVATKCRHRRGPAGPVVRVVGRGARRGRRAHRWRAGGAPRLTSAAGLVRSRRTRGPTNGQEGVGRSTGDRPPLRPVPPCWSPVLFSDPAAPPQPRERKRVLARRYPRRRAWFHGLAATDGPAVPLWTGV